MSPVMEPHIGVNIGAPHWDPTVEPSLEPPMEPHIANPHWSSTWGPAMEPHIGTTVESPQCSTQYNAEFGLWGSRVIHFHPKQEDYNTQYSPL